MLPTDLFLLKWDHHASTFRDALTRLNKTHEYSDATVGCSSALYPVHKIILGACSQYFSEIFESTSGKHPIIILKDIASDVFQVLLRFMYLGQVEVKQEMLPDILSAAECLQIKGLAVTDSNPATDIVDITTPHKKPYRTPDRTIARKRFPKKKGDCGGNFSGVSKRARREEASITNTEHQEEQSSRVNGKTPVTAAEQTTLLPAGLVHSNVQSDHSEDTDPFNDDFPLPCNNSMTNTTETCKLRTDEKLASPVLQQPTEAEVELETIALNSSFKDSSSTDIFEEVSIEEVKAEIQDVSQVSLVHANDLPASQQQLLSQNRIQSQQQVQSQKQVQPQHQAQSQQLVHFLQPQERSPTDSSGGYRDAPRWTIPADTDCGGDSSDVNTSADWDADSSWDIDTPVTDHDAANIPDAEECSKSTHDGTGDEVYVKQEADDLQEEDTICGRAGITSPLVQLHSECGGLFLPSHAIFQNLHPNCSSSNNNMTSSHSLPLRTSTITVTRNFHKTLPSSHFSRTSLGAGSSSSSSSSSWSSKGSSRAAKKALSSAVISKLPEFSPRLQPFLRGLVLGEPERQFLERLFREEVVRFLDSEKLNVTHHAGGNSRWWYHAFGRKLYERYPNIQWTQGPTGKGAAQETRKRPLAPWTSAMKKVSTIRKSRRFLLKKKLEAIKQFSSSAALTGSI